VTVTIEQIDPNAPPKPAAPKAKVEGNDLDESNPAFDVVPLSFNSGCGGESVGAKLKLKKGTWRSTSTDEYTAEVLDGRQTIETSIGPITITGTVEVKDWAVKYLDGIRLKRLTHSFRKKSLSNQR
jgi:hypothetical protein